eukprot:TRINITY_DN28534_c0_g2_i1.p1 TRINITY_DN28534_c0_g2~~TRINITY_DN28534_c0_g2_i1.p1  ORF type:complete len:210 (-),score=29.75 TRINITY_DN28534_c0_g2_i1:167-796(-)
MAQRLAELLRGFKLPPSATQTELRKAYYKRAKLLHPDIAGEASAPDFKRLRQDYEEAQKLLRQAQTGFREDPSSQQSPFGGARWQRPPEEPGWDTPGGQRWKAGAFQSNFHGYTAGYRESDINFDPSAFRAKHRSHTRRDADGGYSYEAAGSGSSSFSSRSSEAYGQRRYNPAHIFKGCILASSFVWLGRKLSSRLSENASTFQGRVYT